MIDILALAVFAGLLIYAACSDVASLTIPNWVSLALVAVFALAGLATGLSLAELGLHFLFGFCVLAVGFFLFHANILGGGDAKLLAAVAVWTGFVGLPEFLLSTAMAGGMIAILLMTARRFAGPPVLYPGFIERLLTPKTGLPYGVAIMAGGLMAAPSLPFNFSSLTLP